METSVSARKSIESGSAHLGRLFHLHSSDMSFTRHLAEINPMGLRLFSEELAMMSLSANMLNLHFHIIAAAISDGVFREKALTVLARALDDLLFHDVILSKHLGHGN